MSTVPTIADPSFDREWGTEAASTQGALLSSPAREPAPPASAEGPSAGAAAPGIATFGAASGLADLPGLDSVGHGIFVRPNGPYELKRVLFRRDKYRLTSFRDAGQAYYLPEGYEIDDSPPMPANQLLNQVMIEESYDRFRV